MAKILVIDDVRVNREVITRLLGYSGHQLLEAKDGQEGLAIVKAARPDLVIVDILMPNMSGYEFVTRLKHDPSVSPTRVIFYSAMFLEGETRDLAKACGVSRILSKPINSEEVLRVVDEVLAEDASSQAPSDEELRYAAEVVHVLNKKLYQKNEELENLNAHLEQMVEERTAGLAAEIEERKRADERFRVLVETAPMGIIIVNRKGLIVDVNAHTLGLFGYERNELIGQSVETLLPEAFRSMHAQHRKSYAHNPHVRPMGIGIELVARRKDGTDFPVEISLGPMVTHGEALVSASIMDITTRKKMEEQLRVSQRMEAIGRLAGGVAHDFNNLLTVILGCCETLSTDLSGNLEALRKIETVKRAGESAADLTRQLLAFGRRQNFQPKVIEPAEVVNGLKDVLKRLIGENIQLVVSVNAGVGCVSADPGQLEQVLLNLVANARDAMPDGGRLAITVDNAELDEFYKTIHPPAIPGPYVMFGVSDTGHGMDEQTRARIFDPFFTTKEIGKGTGLGLATVYGIVKQSGGYIWVYSEAGKGTSFKVYLPRVQRGAAPSLSANRDAVIENGSETILLAEDSESLREMTVEYLKSLGYTILEAASGEEALERACEFKGAIHLLLTDVVMPKMTGRELADHILRDRPAIKILFTSGYTGDAISRHGVLEPGIAFIEKPYRPKALARKIREVLREPADANTGDNTRRSPSPTAV